MIVGEAELLGKDGKTIPHSPLATWTGVAQQPNPEPVAAPEPRPPQVEPEARKYLCDVTTIGRDMDGSEVFKLLDMYLDGMKIEIDGDAFGRLHADLRRHFRRIA